MEALRCKIYEEYIQDARDALALPEYMGVDEGLDYIDFYEATHILSDLVSHVRIAGWVDFYEPWPERLKPSKAQRTEARRLVRDLNARCNREYKYHAMETGPESTDNDLFMAMPVPEYLLACAGQRTFNDDLIRLCAAVNAGVSVEECITQGK